MLHASHQCCTNLLVGRSTSTLRLSCGKFCLKKKNSRRVKRQRLVSAQTLRRWKRFVISGLNLLIHFWSIENLKNFGQPTVKDYLTRSVLMVGYMQRLIRRLLAPADCQATNRTCTTFLFAQTRAKYFALHLFRRKVASFWLPTTTRSNFAVLPI